MTEEQKNKIKELILDLSENIEAMDYMNKLSFPFTSKYLPFIDKKTPIIRTPEMIKKLEDDFDF